MLNRIILPNMSYNAVLKPVTGQPAQINWGLNGTLLFELQSLNYILNTSNFRYPTIPLVLQYTSLIKLLELCNWALWVLATRSYIQWEHSCWKLAYLDLFRIFIKVYLLLRTEGNVMQSVQNRWMQIHDMNDK